MIQYDDFARLALKTARVLTAERHPNADRLLVLTLDAGEATPRTVLAPTDGAKLTIDGRAHYLERRGDEVWATLPDPDREAEVALAALSGRPQASAQAPIVTRRVTLTTGTHREQAYWVAGRRPGELRDQLHDGVRQRRVPGRGQQRQRGCRCDHLRPWRQVGWCRQRPDRHADH